MIEVEGLRFGYQGGPEVLRGLDLVIEEGSYVGIVGANGSGKSTFTKQLNALLLPTEGEVRVDGTPTRKDPDRARSLVGMVLQNPENQIVGTIVEDDVAFGPENLRLEHAEMVARVRASLGRVGLAGLEQRSAEALSGGQKQRLALAGILAMQPRYVVVDEPTAFLDPQGRDEVHACLQDLSKQHGITILHVTHLLDELLDSDRILALAGGEIVYDGAPREFFRDQKRLDALELELPANVQIALRLEDDDLLPSGEVAWTTAGLLEALQGPQGGQPEGGALPGQGPGADQSDQKSGRKAAESDPGADQSDQNPSASAAEGEFVLGVRQVSMEYGRGGPLHVTALDAVDLEVREGELLGLVGATGSGKSTLVQVMARLLEPTAGRVEHAAEADLQELHRSVGVVFQQPEDQLFEPTVFDDVAYGPRQLGVPDDELPGRVTRALEVLGLDPEPLLERSPFDLSGGEKRRVAIAGILSMRPRVLVLDEPTAGLDARARRLLLGNLADLHAERETTIVVVSHDMELLAALATRLVVLDGGRVRATGAPDTLFARETLVREVGLRPPPSVELLGGLASRGWDVPRVLFDPVAAAEAIATEGTRRRRGEP